MMYLYDGSFDGLLTCVFEAFALKENPDVIAPYDGAQYALGGSVREIPTDADKARRVYSGIEQKIGVLALDHIYSAYLSTEPDAGALILQYLRRGFRYGNRVSERLHDPVVMRMTKLERRVWREQHRWLGFLRFSSLTDNRGILFAEFEPESHVLPLIMPHFADRLNTTPFIIHDKGRGVAGVYDTASWFLTSSHTMTVPDYSEDERAWRHLWKGFYEAVAIPERRNLKLQRQLMPLKFRASIHETWEHTP